MAGQCIGVSLFLTFLSLYSVFCTHGARSNRGIINPEFLNRRIYEPNIESVNVRGSVECVTMCSLKIDCVSVQYNNLTKECFFYDDYFTNAEATSFEETDWNYFYLSRVKYFCFWKHDKFFMKSSFADLFFFLCSLQSL